MKCANCAKDSPSGTRYCVHCGAEQALPTPIAAVAAAMAARPRSAIPQAANAARADPGAEDRTLATARDEPAPWPGSSTGTDSASGARLPEAAALPTAAAPAYAGGPRRTGLAVSLLGTCVVAAVIAFAGWQMLRDDGRAAADSSGGRSDDSVMSAFPPEATPPPARRSSVAVSPVVPESASAAKDGARDAMAAVSADVATTGNAQSTAAQAPPVEIKSLPPKPLQRPARRSTADKAPAQLPPVAPAATPEPVPSPPHPPVVAAVAKASPVIDRWARMTDELARCTREDFIARVICDQRVRLRYCKGYWGTISQCPGNPAPDHGQ